MRNAAIICNNILKMIFRRKMNIFVYIIVPILCLIGIVFIYTNSNSRINIGICDNDNTKVSKGISKVFSQNGMKVTNVKENQIKKLVTDQKLDCALIIPNGYENFVQNGKGVNVSLYSIKGEDITTWIDKLMSYTTQNLINIGKASQGNKETFNNIYNKLDNSQFKLQKMELKDKNRTKLATVQAIGMFLMFILLAAIMVCNIILKDRSQKTYFRIFTAVSNSKSYITGNILSGMVIILIQIITCVLALKYIVKIDFNIFPPFLVLITGCFGLVSVAFGILISAFSNTTSQASHISTLIIVPSCMISGCFWPVEYMPRIMQKISYFFPQRWTLYAIQKLQEGAAFTSVTKYILIIIAFAVAFFIIGIYKMKNSEKAKLLA